MESTKIVKKASKTAKIKPAINQPNVSSGKWIIVQLTPLGEREKNIHLIVRSAHRLLNKPLDVFIPAVAQKVRDESQTMFYMDGYIFVRYEENMSYLKLVDTPYFSSVLTYTSVSNGVRKQMFSLLNDKDIDPLRNGMQTLKIRNFQIGQSVKIIKGNFKNLQADISYIHDDGEHAQVHVKLKSKPVLMDFPVSYLKAIEQ